MTEQMNRYLYLVIIIFAVLLCQGCAAGDNTSPGGGAGEALAELSPVEKIPPGERNVYDLVVLGARWEVEKGVSYEAAYVQIEYPGGDVPPDQGVCTDVVVRAFRNAGIDLQELIHEDMKSHFGLYPQNWGLRAPDANIDHRRVPNQMKFFERHGETLTMSIGDEDLSQWQWGDIVYWKFPNGLEHCGIISDRKNHRGMPLVIHNAGLAREEDCLDRWQITGHYRYPRGF